MGHTKLRNGLHVASRPQLAQYGRHRDFLQVRSPYCHRLTHTLWKLDTLVAKLMFRHKRRFVSWIISGLGARLLLWPKSTQSALYSGSPIPHVNS